MFQLDESQKQRLNVWIRQQELKVADEQQRSNAYYGAIGGAYEYCFLPTSIGLIVKVKNGLTKEEIDLSDYENW